MALRKLYKYVEFWSKYVELHYPTQTSAVIVMLIYIILTKLQLVMS